ncbi:MFS transporter [Buchnera aphidicola]|uniref:MFS transporter n=1 Tax=Buchnera aphidicola TaxID=9 RepID=UPI003464B036
MFYLKKNIQKENHNDYSLQSNDNNHAYVQKGTKQFIRIILALFFAGFSTFSILYSLQPILPTFSIEFHLTPYQSSLSLSLATASMAIGMLLTGSLSDFFGRKIIMSISLFLSTFFTILCACMNTWNEIIIMRLLTGFSLSGVAAVAMTYLSEEINPKILPFAIGLYISGNTIGGFFGRFLSSILINYFSWNMSIMIMGCLCLIASILFVVCLPSSINFKSTSLKPRQIIYDLICQWNDKLLSVLFIIGFILMGSFVTVFNYIGYRLMMKPFFLNQIMIGLLSIVYLFGVYTSPRASSLIEKYGRKNIVIYSVLIMIMGIIITQSNTLFVIIIGLILFSSGFFAAHSIASSWIGHQAKIYTGQASSVYLCSYYLGSSVLGTCGGFFWSFGRWMGVSIFISFVLIIGIKMMSTIKSNIK